MAKVRQSLPYQPPVQLPSSLPRITSPQIYFTNHVCLFGELPREYVDGVHTAFEERVFTNKFNFCPPTGVATLPGELSRNFSLVRELDEQSQRTKHAYKREKGLGIVAWRNMKN